MSNSQYSSLMEEMQKADKANGGQVFESVPKLFIQEGVYQLRILPSNDKGSKVPFAIFKLHSYLNPNYPESKKPAPWVCAGSGCAMCTKAFQTAAAEKTLPKEQKTAWKLFPRSMAHYHVIDLADNTVKILCADKNDQYETGLHDAIMQEFKSQLDQGINPFDSDDGRVLHIDYRKVDNKKKYIVQFDNESNSVPNTASEKLAKLRPLSRIYWKNTNEELKKVIDGVPFSKGKKDSESGSDSSGAQMDSNTTQASQPSQSARENLFPVENVDNLPMGGETDDEIERMKADIFGPTKK